MKEITTSLRTDWKQSVLEPLIRLFPLMFIMAIVPLIVRIYPYYAELSQYAWFTADDLQIDYFSHGKAVALYAIGIYMLLLLITYTFLGKLEKRRTWILIPVVIYAVFAFVSSCISPYSSYSFKGVFEEHETIWVVLVYCLIVVYAYYMIRSVKEIRVLLYSFATGMLFLTVTGFMAAFNYSPLTFDWVTRLTIPSEHMEALDGIVEYNADATTLYNQNYVGVYMSMAVPVLLFLLLDFNKNKSFQTVKASILTILNVIVFATLLIGTLFCLYKSDSEAGILALCAGIVFIPIVFWRKLWKHKTITLVGIAVAVVAVVVFGKAYLFPAINLLASQFTAESREHTLSSIHTDETGVTFTYKGKDIRFAIEEVDDSYLIFQAYDGDGNILEAETDGWNFTFTEEPYSDFSVAYYPIYDQLSMSITIKTLFTSLGGEAQHVNYIFTNQTGTGTYQMVSYYGQWCDLQNPERVTLFDGKEELFSGRFYIWSRSIPLLKQSAVLGIGADNFVFAFPQMDYVGRYYSNYAYNEVFTKPHNMYLEIGIQYGVPALIAYLVLFGMYFVQSFKIFSRKPLDSFEAKAGMGIFIAMIVYMITSLANDSTVVVAPVFWALWGIGLVINRMLEDKVADKENSSVPEITEQNN